MNDVMMCVGSFPAASFTLIQRIMLVFNDRPTACGPEGQGHLLLILGLVPRIQRFLQIWSYYGL